MQTVDAIQQRRAVKHFDPNHQLSKSEIEKLFSLTLLSPTSFNIQNWRFVHVTDVEERKEVRAAAWDQAQITDASALIIVCADLKSWNDRPERYWRNAPKEIQDRLIPMIKSFYDGREQMQRDEAMRSCGIAAQTIMLTAKSMGYDSCPMVGFDFDKVAEIIKLPPNHVVGLIVVVGKALSEARERGGQLPLNEVVIENKFV
jgi:nitroreductase